MKKTVFIVCIFVCLFMVFAGQASDQKLVTQALINRTISGTCFSDEDMSGKQEDSEAGTEGVEVTLKRLIFPGAPLTATTDADGYYKFTDLPMGFFIIEAKVGDEDTKTTTNPVTLWLGFNGINKEINFGINKTITTTTSVQATTTSVPTATTSVPTATTSVPTECADRHHKCADRHHKCADRHHKCAAYHEFATYHDNGPAYHDNNIH